MLKNFLLEIRFALGDAWKEVIDLPVPRWFGAEGSSEPSRLTAAALPLLGWLFGLIPMVAGILTCRFFNRYAGVLIFAASAWALCYFRDFGKSDALVGRILLRRFGRTEEPVPVMLLIAAVLRFAIFAVIALNGGMMLCPLIFAGTFGIQSELATHRYNPSPLLPAGCRRAMRGGLIAAFVLALVCCRLPAVVLALVFALAERCFADRMKLDGFTSEAITAAGAFTEWALIFCAMLTA